MHFTTVIASALTATAVIAAPLEKRVYTTLWVVDVVTQTSTVYGTPPAATPAPVGALQGPPAVVPTSSSVAPPPVATTASAAAAPPPASSPVSSSAGPADYSQCQNYVPGSTPDYNTIPSSCGVSILATANYWRSLYGKTPFQWDPELAQAAWSTLDYNKGGVTEVHPGLVDSSHAEVISPGFVVPSSSMKLQGNTPFEVALINWLCEVPSDAQLQASGPTHIDQCAISSSQASIEETKGETEHHDIFISDAYTHIGCGYRGNDNGDGGWPQFAGQWVCDFN